MGAVKKEKWWTRQANLVRAVRFLECRLRVKPQPWDGAVPLSHILPEKSEPVPSLHFFFFSITRSLEVFPKASILGTNPFLGF